MRSGIEPQMAQRHVSAPKVPSQLTSLSLSILLFFVAVAVAFLAAAASATAGAIFATSLLHCGQTQQQFAAGVRGSVYTVVCRLFNCYIKPPVFLEDFSRTTSCGSISGGYVNTTTSRLRLHIRPSVGAPQPYYEMVLERLSEQHVSHMSPILGRYAVRCTWRGLS